MAIWAKGFCFFSEPLHESFGPRSRIHSQESARLLYQIHLLFTLGKVNKWIVKKKKKKSEEGRKRRAQI